MTDISPAFASSQKGTVVTIEVTAGSKTSCFPAGYNAWRSAVGCRVRAPAHEGRANREVIQVIAERLGIEKTRVCIVSGSTSSVKKVLVAGVTPDELRAALSYD